MKDKAEYTFQTQTFGTCPQCLKKYRVTKDGYIYDHGQCWGSYDLPLEVSAESLERSLSNLKRKHNDRVERKAAGETLEKYEIEKLRSRPKLIAEYQKRIDKWTPSELEHRIVQVKKRKKSKPASKKTCCVCGRTTRIKKDGSLYEHSNAEMYRCAGSDKLPIEDSADDCYELRDLLANEIATARMYISLDLARKPEWFLNQIDENRKLLLSTQELLSEHKFAIRPIVLGSLFLEKREVDSRPRITSQDWALKRIEPTTTFSSPDMSDFKDILVEHRPYQERAKKTRKRSFWSRLFG